MITIRHTRADGTLIEDSVKGDGVYEIVRPHGFHYFPSIGQIGIRNSRDRAAQRSKINAASAALRAAGFEVQTVVDEDDRRPFAVAEAERNSRSESRAAGYTEQADQAQANSDRLNEQARERSEAIPLGQPTMPGRSSFPADRRARDRTQRMWGKAVEEGRRAAYLAACARAAEDHQRHRNDPAVTLRRIGRLETQLRRIHKWLAGQSANGHKRSLAPEGLAELHREEEETADELTYWRTLIAQAEADGFIVYGPSHFVTGDYAQHDGRWYEVLRVNAKSLTVPGGPDVRPVISDATRAYSWNDRMPYDGVTGQMSAARMKELRSRRAARPQE
ncbi:DUF3560 domain-containing protein (plasmid) [Streptomyces globisporus]|uniref:DUF3560 domain-containing protein n=1 Tax=Streptomyces globisporus TaxID=1908 RepID=UPI00386DF0CC|nr:DUF3560 domain-containing protein [Streptomyces globisporus]